MDIIIMDQDTHPDLDLNWSKILDLDLNSMYLDPQQSIKKTLRLFKHFSLYCTCSDEGECWGCVLGAMNDRKS